MSDAIIVAQLSGGMTLIGTIITVVLSHRSTISTLEKNSELADQQIKGEIGVVNEKIEELSRRVEKHNQVVERTYAQEQKAAVMEEKLEFVHDKLKEIKEV